MPEEPDFDDLQDCRFGCGPVPVSPAPRPAPRGAATPRAAGAAADDAGVRDRLPPEILLRSNHAWRKTSLQATAHIPSGYTYLGQLMGHDMGSSVPLSSVPHVTRGNVIGAVSVLGPRRYNLIDNPLTLETVYGSGPMMLSHVYDPDTMLFRLTPGARLARVYRGSHDPMSQADNRPIRALYDERNRDTLMLHELAVAWMQFHNLCARRLLASGRKPFEAYAMARAHSVRVWHGIIRDDILARFLHPEIAAMAEDDLPPEWRLDEVTLLHGLFRAFHAMPLAAYDLGRQGMHNLADLLKSGFDVSEAESDWNIDWPLFFGLKPGGPMTGLSASVAPELRAPTTAAAVIALDNSAAAEARPLRPGNAKIEAALALLPAPWPTRLAPLALATEFRARHPDSPVDVTADMIEWGPLFQMIMIEAQLYGQKGGLGPFGSALLRASITGTIDRVVLAPEQEGAGNLPRPATMMKLIELVREV
ncbi:hypothetical protein [Paracoccus marinaquae]|uniref:Animal haem peroxidase n=1 Tax=Paracoccus marinaquae TaxID=2841926 RepID=A0ABS6AKG4_9RHOB|nr:hypothetical protein [Paracoccus marinaquae]MBU3029901.1 hypothetical protein [Paracoccus marinaquae]